MDTSAFLHYVVSQPGYGGQVAHVEHLPARPARHRRLRAPLPGELVRRLEERHLLPLYSHQARAVELARDGRNVMVATPSASGKTLCYNIPVLAALLEEPSACALYLFPTKALAQDQLRSLRDLACPGLLPATDVTTFDGDTPPLERGDIRRRARIILSNPDMLHVGILPAHPQWSRLLRRLRFVVIDEAHTYRGVFGSHLAGVLRRLQRLCRHYGSDPRFIASSATVANPGEHAEKLTGLAFEVVDDDGSPRGPRDFIFWNPPLVNPARSARRSANTEATNLFTELVSHRVRTLAFTRTRRLTELVYTYSRDRLATSDPELAGRIRPYRAGYLARDRRQIEQALFSGELLGVVATNALELGIDIGDLEATLLTGYPGSIASTWQQAGRSGRGEGHALSILIGQDNPLDQYLMRHPEAFFGRSFENALINPENPYILRAHLLCAAWELPLGPADEAFFGPEMAGQVAELVRHGALRERRGRFYPTPAVSHPARGINIRSSSSASYSLIDASSGNLLETVEADTAIFQIYPGAIYLHQGEAYLVKELNPATRTAHLVPVDTNYYTQTKELTDLHITRLRREKRTRRTTVYLGEVEVTTSVIGFKKMAQYTDEVLGEEDLSLPPQQFPTVALWFDLPPGAMDRVEREGLDLAGGLHAVEHAAIAILPLFALCDRNDIGGLSTTLHPDTGRAQVFIYDAHPGGIGIAERGFEMITRLWDATLKTVVECPCQEGCPGCIQSPKCGNNNRPLDKQAARLLLEGLLFTVRERET